MSPWYFQGWTPGLSCSCCDCPKGAELSFSRTSCVSVFFQNINLARHKDHNPSPCTPASSLPSRGYQRGSKAWGDYSHLHHKTLYTYFGIATLSLYLLFILNRAETAVSALWWCTWHMIGNLKWWTSKTFQFCEKVFLLNMEYGSTAFLNKDITMPMKIFHFIGRNKQKVVVSKWNSKRKTFSFQLKKSIYYLKDML